MDGHNDPSADERLTKMNGEEFYEAMEWEGPIQAAAAVAAVWTPFASQVKK